MKRWLAAGVIAVGAGLFANGASRVIVIACILIFVLASRLSGSELVSVQLVVVPWLVHLPSPSYLNQRRGHP
jgi:hypothetical protein